MLNNIDVENIIRKNIGNEELRRYAIKYKKESRKVYGKIKDNNDVEKYLNEARNVTNFYEKDFSAELDEEDMEDMEIALADYENAVSKVLNCYDSPTCNFKYNANEIKQLIDHVYEFETCIDNEWMRKACQVH